MIKKNRKNITWILLMFINISCSSSGGVSNSNVTLGNNYSKNIEEPEITDKNVKITNSNFSRWKVYGEDKINLEYTADAIKSERISREDIKQTKNPVYISEYDFNETDYRFNLSKFSNLKTDDKTLEKFKVSKPHGEKVFDAFLDSNYDGYYDRFNEKLDENAEINMSSPKYYLSIKDDNEKYGIVNMSHGSTTFTGALDRLNRNYGYINKAGKKAFAEMGEYLSELVQDKDYKYNRWLKVVSLGNTNDLKTKGRWYTSHILSNYQISSPEIQRAMRSETILVKNSFYHGEPSDSYSHTFQTTKKGKKVDEMFYEIGDLKKYDASALGLRAFTVGALGINTNAERWGSGSSFSAPRVSRLAYELKKKFPYLTLHQIKEVILGTADHDNSGYLNDVNGWGQVDYKKAMNGPSDFNAGLIEETKYFAGQFSKIYDEEHNRYFYVDTQGKNSEWSNDIQSGLEGDGNSTDYKIYPILGTDKADYKEARPFKYRLPKVLDSERLYYRNIATAGLRKDGDGELILSGRQLYKDKIQVLGGTLTLKNSADSRVIEVFNGAILNLDGTKKIKLNDIISDSKVNFKTSVDMKDYKASKDSITVFSSGVKLNANSVVLGDYSVNNIKNIEDLKGIITSMNIETGNLKNIYLKAIEKREGEVVVIDFEENGKYPKLNELSDYEKRNIPSYNLNEGKFFEEYLSNKEFKYVDISKEKKSTAIKLLNLTSNNEELTKSQIFTDNYSTYLRNLFDSNLNFENDRFNEYFKKQGNKNRITFNTYTSRNFVDSKEFTKFSKQFTSYNLKYNNMFNNNFEFGVFGSYLITNFEFLNKSNFNNTGFSIGLNTISRFKYLDLITENILTYNNTDIKRDIQNREVKANLDSLLSENSIYIKKNFRFINNVITPFIGINLQVLRVFENKGEEGDYSTKVLDTVIFNNKISTGVNVLSKLTNRFEIENRLKLDLNLNKDIKLNVKVLDTEFKSVGQNLDIFAANYNLNLKYKLLDNMKINTNFNINSKGNIGLGFSMDLEF